MAMELQSAVMSYYGCDYTDVSLNNCVPCKFGASATGRVSSKIEPPSGFDLAEIRPPNSSTIPREIYNPRPKPLPPSLVVKNAEKRLGRHSGKIPEPLSSTLR